MSHFLPIIFHWRHTTCYFFQLDPFFFAYGDKDKPISIFKQCLFSILAWFCLFFYWINNIDTKISLANSCPYLIFIRVAKYFSIRKTTLLSIFICLWFRLKVHWNHPEISMLKVMQIFLEKQWKDLVSILAVKLIILLVYSFML